MAIIKTENLEITVKKNGSSVHFITEHGRFYATRGNKKVKVPVISAGPAGECPNASICEFSHLNYKEAGTSICYAFKAERIYPSVKKARYANETVLRALHEAGHDYEFGKVVGKVMAELAHKMEVKFLRFNESSDLSGWNIKFFQGVSNAAIAEGVKPYTYSKSSQHLVKKLTNLGVTVQISQDDFVVVEDAAEAEERGLVVCPGEECGTKCTRCMFNLKTAVIRH